MQYEYDAEMFPKYIMGEAMSKLKQMIDDGVIGKLQAIRAEYSYDVFIKE